MVIHIRIIRMICMAMYIKCIKRNVGLGKFEYARPKNYYLRKHHLKKTDGVVFEFAILLLSQTVRGLRYERDHKV